MANDITFEEFLALSRITFEWADSYDAKVSDKPFLHIIIVYFASVTLGIFHSLNSLLTQMLRLIMHRTLTGSPPFSARL